MNTPAHILVSAAILSRSSTSPPNRTCLSAAVAGALLPDALMFVFYGVEKFVLGQPERLIWSERYFLNSWQDLFDVFNSFPIALIGLAVACWIGSRWWMILFASMLIHFALDLPLHHDDGHRHFFPLSHWRYQSPVSYWDPRHFGLPVAFLETVLTLGCYAVCFRRHPSRFARIGLGIVACLELLMFFGLVAFVWYQAAG